MAGVMVVYHPPITHLPLPAVGASPDAAIMISKGPADAHHSAAEPAGKNPGFSWHISGPL